MTVEDAPGRVTICSRGRQGLYADQAGLIVRSGARRTQRFAWSEVSAFADGSQPDGSPGGDEWVLHVLLRSGGVCAVRCTGGRAGEVLPAVRQVAERYRIPADLAGVKMTKGRPTTKGLFEDPGGEAGVRYWDGTQWSPLLAPSLGQRLFIGVSQSAAPWGDLPTVQHPWDYPAIRAARAKAWIWVCGVVTAALLVAGVAVGLAQRSWDAVWAFCMMAAIFSGFVLIPLSLALRFWKLVKQAAEGEPWRGLLAQPPAGERQASVYRAVAGSLICEVISGALLGVVTASGRAIAWQVVLGLATGILGIALGVIPIIRARDITQLGVAGRIAVTAVVLVGFVICVIGWAAILEGPLCAGVC